MRKTAERGFKTLAVSVLGLCALLCVRCSRVEAPATRSNNTAINNSAARSTEMPYGILGHPLGSYLTIEGVRAEKGKVGAQTLLVDTVNGTKLKSPVSIWVDNVQALPQGTRCVLRGYESGRIIGQPWAYSEAAKEEGKPPPPQPQVGWQFSHYLFVMSVVQPKDLEIKGPSASHR